MATLIVDGPGRPEPGVPFSRLVVSADDPDSTLAVIRSAAGM
jgi:hypothetical protein